MEIIKLDVSEWEKYKSLRLEALKNDSLAFGSAYEEAADKRDEKWQAPLQSPNNYLLFAKDKDDLVGMVAAYGEEGQKVEHIAYVWGVYVRKEHRGKGVGKKLMEALLDELQAAGFVKANLGVNTIQKSAEKLYESLGFEIIGISHKELKIEGEYYDECLMEKIFED